MPGRYNSSQITAVPENIETAGPSPRKNTEHKHLKAYLPEEFPEVLKKIQEEPLYFPPS